MDALKVVGLFTVVPTVVLITISFFVTVILTKAEKKFLRIFGMVVVVLLWAAAFIVFSTGIFLIASAPDYPDGHRPSKTCLCQCPYSSMMGSGCSRMDKPYHKTMNPHAGMMNPHAGMMDPEETNK